MASPTSASPPDRPVPSWYDDAKLGIFIHWGIYSVPGWAPLVPDVRANLDPFAQNPYAEWYQNTLRIEGSPTQKRHAETWGVDFAYRDFAPRFDEAARAWRPERWADLFARAGAGYAVLTSKHHDGFLLWPSAHRNPRAPGFVAERDLVGELADAVRARGLRFGLYYSGGIDWLWHDLVIRSIRDLLLALPPGPEYEAYATAHWDELIERYRPCSMWNDISFPGSLEHIEALHARYYARVPDGVVNDRWRHRLGPEGLVPLVPHDVTTPEYERVADIRPRKWEAVRGIGNSFGFNRAEGPDHYLSSRALLELFVDVVSKNGNLLIDVGPTAEGEIPELQQRPLLDLGAWLDVHG